jgi:tetratricopeptide (TPR) repeat protein
LSFAQTNQAINYPKVKVDIVETQELIYPEDALIQEKEGIVICRVFLDKNKEYQKHHLLYATHEELTYAVEQNLAEMQFEIFNAPAEGFHFLVPFVFEFNKNRRESRPRADLMQDGNACLKFGLHHLAMGYYDQILKGSRKKDSDMFDVYEARMKAALYTGKWMDARREATNMLASARDANSAYAHHEPVLRVQRSVLSLLAGQASSAVADINWLNKRGEHNIFLISEFVEKLHLTQNQALQFAWEAERLQLNMPAKQQFWLPAMAGVALNQGRYAEKAYQKFEQLRQQEQDPVLQAGLLCQMGWCLYNLGKPVEALSHLQEATLLSPQMAQAHFYKALSLAKLDYGTEAYESMRSAVELGLPHHQQSHGQQLLSIMAVSNR